MFDYINMTSLSGAPREWGQRDSAFPYLDEIFPTVALQKIEIVEKQNQSLSSRNKSKLFCFVLSMAPPRFLFAIISRIPNHEQL